MASDPVAILALALTPGLGPRRIKLLLECFGNARCAWQAGSAALQEVEGIGPELAQRVGDERIWEQACQLLERTRRRGVEVLTIDAPSYPAALRTIYDPPPVLYLRGKLNLERAVAIVGTRSPTPYGQHMARELARHLAQHGVTVVSGMARGIDAQAHIGALETGTTIAVLGCGVNVAYPIEHWQLAETIAQRGALLSEYPLSTQPLAGHFPARNRIVAGLSAGVVLVEGGTDSGALITADLAMSEGRSVMAVPGPVGPRSAGPHKLLRDGAALVESAEDVLRELGWDDVPAAQAPPPALPPGEQAVYQAIGRQTPSVDELVAQCGLEAAEVSQALARLALKGLVRELPGARYGRV
ncbi:MAG: DNA-protecting protein DprA [Deinococcus sp.]|nr:DNA-protecting protein DprA [Deinococcus sp.]